MTLPVCDHARERVLQRHGRDLTDAEWLAAVALILDRRAVLLGVSGSGRDIYAIPMGAVVLRVVWCPAVARVITVLPEATRVVLRPSRAPEVYYRGGKRMRAGRRG